MLNLEPIKARLAKITPGPWMASNPWGYDQASRLRVISAPGGPVSTAYNDVDGCNNADFVAAAPQDMAALVAEVERLRALVAEGLKQAPSDETYIGDFEGYKIFVADKKLEKYLNKYNRLVSVFFQWFSGLPRQAVRCLCSSNSQGED